MSGCKVISPLPIGWVGTDLGAVVAFEYGKSLTGEKRDNNGLVPVYGSSGIVGHHSASLVKEQSIIVGRKGAIGSTYLAECPSWPIDTTYFIIPPKELNLHYLFYLLKTLRLSSLDKSTAIPGLNRNDAYKLNVPIAPFNEQKRIVSKVEALFSFLDIGVELLSNVQTQLKRYRQAVLKYAFEGNLTGEWRKKHETSIEVESNRVNQQDEQTLGRLPIEWSIKTLGSCSILITKGESPKWQGFDYVENGISFIRSENVLWGIINIDNVVKIPVEFHIKLKRSQVRAGDVLVNLVGASIGRCGIVPSFVESANINQAVAIVRVNSSIISEYLVYLFISPRMQKLIHSSKVETARPNISLNDLRQLKIPLPKLEEQAEIVRQISKRLEILDATEITVKIAKKRSERLRQSILKKAFDGKLVLQDPNDESAEKLLERAKTQRYNCIKDKISNQVELSNYVK